MSILARKELVVDYGSTHIKGALVETSPLGGRRILRLETLPIVSLSKEGDNKAEEYEYNLVRFVQSFFPEEENFLLNVPMDRVYVRDIKVPVVTAKQIDDVIPFEVEPLLPVSLENAEVIGKPWEIGEESSSVISFTAQHNDLARAVQPILKGSASVQMLSVDCVGLAGASALASAPEGRMTGQIDIGGSYTIVNFIKDGNLVFTRRIPVAGQHITEAIGEVLGLDAAHAEEKKLELELDLAEDLEKTERSEAYYRRNRIDKRTIAKLQKAIKEVMLEIIQEVERTVLSLPAQEDPVVWYLSGGGSLMRGTAEFLSSQLDSPVKPYPVQLSPNQKEIGRFMTALGTLEHSREKPANRFDFLSTAFGLSLRRSDFTLRAMSTPILFASLGLIVLLLSFLLGIVLDRRQIRQYRDQLELIARDLPPDVKNADNYLEAAERICKERLQYRKNQTGSARALDVLRELTNKMPPQTELPFSLKSFRFQDGKVDFEAEVGSFGDVTKVKDALASSTQFARVDMQPGNLMPNQKVRIAVRVQMKEQATGATGSCR